MAIVRVEQLDGGWQELDTIGDPVVSADDFGHLSCSFTVAADSSLPQAALSADTPLEIEDEGVSIFEGVIAQTPEEQDDNTISVQGVGDQAGLDDDLVFRWWLHSRLDDWQDSRQMPGADLTGLFAAAQVQADKALLVQMANGDVWPAAGSAGFTLDFGTAENGPLRVVLSYLYSTGGGLSLYVRSTDQTHPVSPPAGTFEDPVSGAAIGASGTVRGTLSERRRYLHVFLYRSTAVTFTADVSFAITKLLAFRDTAFESGDASVLKADALVKDVLSLVPGLSGDVSEIEAPTPALNLPEAMTGDGSMSPRQVVEKWNAPHNFQARARPRTKRLQYRARPLVPKYKVGAWANRRFRHAALTSRDGLYNHVVVTGQDNQGQPLRVERTSTRRAQVQPVNPSFDTNTTSWAPQIGTVFTRDTGVFDTAPASGRLSTGGAAGGAVVQADIGAGFVKGKQYTFRLRLRRTASTYRVLVGMLVGSSFEEKQVPVELLPVGTFATVDVPLVAPAGASGTPVLTVTAAGPASTDLVYIDTVEIREGASLLDRRNKVRSQELQIGGTVDYSTLQQIGDAFLAQALTTPLQGTLPVSPGEVREYLTDRPVHPRELVNNTGELVHFADMVDPNSGALGRDGRVVAVNDYHSGDGTAELEISAVRTSFDQLLAKHDIVAGV